MNELNEFTQERIARAVINALDDEKLLYKEVCMPFNTIPLYFTYLRNPKYWSIIPKKVWDRFRTWMISGKKLKGYKMPEPSDDDEPDITGETKSEFKERMKKLLFFITLTMMLGVSAFSQTEKKFKLTPVTVRDFEPTTATVEDFKESCLHNFYNALSGDPRITGLPDDYNKFKTALLNPEKSLAFYNFMATDSDLMWVVPETYQGFLGAYGLDKIPDVTPDVSSIFQSSPAETFDNHSIYDSEETIRLKRELRLVQEQRLELEREMEDRYKRERTNSIFDASRLVIDAISGSMEATIPDYYNQNSWQTEKEDDYSIYPTLPGTEIRDYSRPGATIEGNTIYKTLPGTNIRDYSKPGYKIEKKNK